MSLLDQFFVYHPEPWQDRDRARISGLLWKASDSCSPGGEAVWLVCEEPRYISSDYRLLWNNTKGNH